ncbi:MAG TPA: putative ABC exporter domain-containing protein [Lacunisphaera sp.]|nr:putative ABC exporter domain-containing protein [Lacunisphaera sp.]
MPVFRALLYLRLTSAGNKLLATLRRLRQPKYLLGAAAAAAYFWFFFVRPTTSRHGPGQLFGTLLAPGHVELVAAIVLSLFVLLIWVTPTDNPGLSFSEAEVAFLFPAPLARRQLIHYKLLDGLLMSLLGAVFFTLLAGGMNSGWTGALRKLGAWWSLNANLTLHQTAAALTVARLARVGLSASRRRWLILGGSAIALMALGAWAIRADAASLAWLLWPARFAVGPFLATSPGDYLLSLCPAFGLVALHYFWIHRMETPFEEASIALAQKRGETLSRMRAGKALRFGGKMRAKSGPFRLGDRLPVEAAFLWKNLMAAPAWINRKLFLGAAVLLWFGLAWLKNRPDLGGTKAAATAAMIAFVLLGYLLIFGPQLARNDLRGDIGNADMLKAYPLPGWRILLGSLLAPTVILSGIAWLLLLVVGVGLAPSGGRAAWLTPELRIVGTLSLAVIMPFLCAVQLLVPNAATVIFPAWSQSTRNLSGGMDVMGQRLIFFAGQFVCLALAMLPALLVGGGTIFLTQWLIGPTAATALAVIPVLAVFAAELWLGARLLGPRFDRLDISAELRP